MRLTCKKYPELRIKGRDYDVRFKGGEAKVTDRKAVAALKKYVESEAAAKHGVTVVDEPKAESKPDPKKDEGKKAEGKKADGETGDGKAEGKG